MNWRRFIPKWLLFVWILVMSVPMVQEYALAQETYIIEEMDMWMSGEMSGEISEDAEVWDVSQDTIPDAEGGDISQDMILDAEGGDVSQDMILDAEVWDVSQDMIPDAEAGDVLQDAISDAESGDVLQDAISDAEAADVSQDMSADSDFLEILEIEEISIAESSEAEVMQSEILQPEIQITYINPLYRDVISEADLMQMNQQPGMYGISPASDLEYGTLDQAEGSFRDMMKLRQGTIKVGFHSSVEMTVEELKAIINDIPHGAMKHTGIPIEGDYLKWQYAGWSVAKGAVRGVVLADGYGYSIEYVVTYYTTAAQETELNKKIAELKNSLGLNDAGLGNDKKVKNIYDYICSNVRYDHNNLNNTAYKLKFTAYAAVMNKTAVCQGYALLFYRLALEAGIDARLIPGEGNGENHGWNIVRLGGLYYNLDATWDEGKTEYLYFLKNEESFGVKHKRFADYKSEEFHVAYPMAEADYPLIVEDGRTHTCLAYGTVKENAVKATCETAGSYEAVTYCAVCEKELSRELQTVAATGHMPGEAVQEHVTEATCTAEGSYESVVYCSVEGCGAEISRTQKTLGMKAHMEVEDAAVEATCEKTGLTKGSHCAVCKKVLTEQKVIPAACTPGAAKRDEATVIAATCEAAGSYDEVVSCTVCLKEISRAKKTIDAKRHTPGVAVQERKIEATCTSEGSYESVVYCSVEGCGVEISRTREILAVKGHTPGAAVQERVTEATCTAEGSYESVVYCSVEGCGAEISRAQKSLGMKEHAPGAAVQERVTEATCTAEGSYESVVYCSVEGCGAEISRTRETLAAKEHTEVEDAARAATCEKTGLTKGSHCAVCEKVLTAQNVIPLAACTPGAMTKDEASVVAASCEMEGSYEEVVSCTVCSKEISRTRKTIKATGHTEVKDPAVAATCTVPGWTAGSHCAVCGEILAAQTVLPAMGHRGEWRTVSEATVHAPKQQERICTVCGSREMRSIGEPLEPTISVNAKSVSMRVNQKTTALKVDYAAGDSVASWSVNKPNYVKITKQKDGTLQIRALKKTGTVKVTIRLESGEKKTVKITVGKKKIATTSLKLEKKKVTIGKGKTYRIVPIIRPITSQDKVTFRSSNKKIATVSSKGLVKAKKKGTVKITVRSGKKKAVCTVKVK